MEYIQLINGVEMPKLGFGVYQIPPRITERCVSDAINVGYRSIDTAQCYGNESAVGKAVRNSGIPREDVFITTKLWACSGYQDTKQSIEGSMRKLGMDYIDLLLIHEPTGNVHEIYRAMEDVYKEGYLKAIGISNFLPERYQDLVTHCSIVPAVNQVETHVFRQQQELRNLMTKYGTKLEAWSPLASGENGIFKNKILCDIAKKHEKTVAQMALRFLYQQDIIIIPKSTHIERMKENINVLDFSLDKDEVKMIEKLEVGKSLFHWW